MVYVRRKPNPWPAIGAYGVVTAFGALALPIVIDAYFSFQAGPNRPVFVGWAIVAVGAVTAAGWAMRLTGGLAPGPALALAGRAALLVAVTLGFIHLGPEVGRIVARS